MRESPLLPIVRGAIGSDPAAVARWLEAMTETEAVEGLKALPPDLACAVFPHLQVAFGAKLIEQADEGAAERLVAGLDASRGAAILLHLSADARDRFLPRLPERLREEIREQLRYPEDSVGRLMSTQPITFRIDATVGAVQQRLRGFGRGKVPASYLYVVDGGNHLLGVLNVYDVLVSDPATPLEGLTRRDVFALDPFTEREEAARELAKRRYFAAPVADAEGRLLGLVRAEQLMGRLQEEVGAQWQRMVGAGTEERVFSPMRFSLRKRLPWLHVNLLTAFLAAAVVAVFEGLISRITALAVFLPVVAGQGGNAGAQSLAIVMRGLVMREIPAGRWGKLVIKEGGLGAVTGAATGLVTALIAWAWYGNPFLGLVVGAAMLVNLFAAGLAGAAIPLGMRALRLDPAQCSSIILTTVTDVVGFATFLGFALAFEPLL